MSDWAEHWGPLMYVYRKQLPRHVDSEILELSGAAKKLMSDEGERIFHTKNPSVLGWGNDRQNDRNDKKLLTSDG